MYLPIRLTGFLLFLFFSVQLSAQHNAYIDSLENLLTVYEQENKRDTVTAILLRNLAVNLAGNNPDKVIVYANKLQVLSKELGYNKGIGNSYTCLGFAADDKGEYQKSIEAYQAAVPYYKKAGDMGGVANCYNNCALAYTNWGKYDQALEQHLKSLEIRREIGDGAGVGVSYGNIGMLYHALGKYSEALESQYKSLEYKKVANDTYGIALSYSNIGNAYCHLDQYFEAEKYLKLAIDQLNEMGDLSSLASTNNLLGLNYYRQNNYSDALKYYTIANNLYLETGNAYGLAMTGTNIGITQTFLKNYSDARVKLNEAIELALNIGSLENTQTCYNGLANLDSLEGKYLGALKNYKLHILYRDSLLNNENSDKLSALQVKFETAEKEQQIELLSIESDKQRQQRNAMMLGSGLLILALGAGGMAYRKTKKYNQFLSEEEQRKEALLQEVHHRTNNSLQLISALLTMQGEQIEDPKAKGFIQQSESRIHSMSALHELLHNNATDIEVNMADYLGNILDFHQSLAPEGIEITSNLVSQQFQAKVAMPVALITNELITNSLKYAFEDQSQGKIHVTLSETDNSGEWTLSVSDNGKGLPDNAFQEGVGNVGSKLITILTRQIGGKLVAENSKGAVVNIVFDPNRKK